MGRPPVPLEIESDAAALAYWHEHGDLLARMHLLTRAHGHALAQLAFTSADLDRARAAYRAMGHQTLIVELLRDKDGNELRRRVRINPLVPQIARLTAQLRDWLGEFGLTPSTQTKVHADTPPSRVSRYITPA